MLNYKRSHVISKFKTLHSMSFTCHSFGNKSPSQEIYFTLLPLTSLLLSFQKLSSSYFGTLSNSKIFDPPDLRANFLSFIVCFILNKSYHFSNPYFKPYLSSYAILDILFPWNCLMKIL